jgi:hypothetical protein
LYLYATLIGGFSAKDEVERIGEQDDEIIEEEREEVLFLHKAEVENQRGRQRKLYCGTRSFEVFARAQRGYSAEDGGNGTNALHFREGEIIRNVQRIDTQTWEGRLNSSSIFAMPIHVSKRLYRLSEWSVSSLIRL